jgi:hypothetical protein
MGEITRRFPSLSLEHVRTLSEIIAIERNAVALVNRPFKRARWGMGCMLCDVVKQKLDRASRDGAYPWFRYVPELGNAYTVVIGSVPLRVQPEVDDIRDVMPGERRAMDTMRSQFLWPEQNATYDLVLRLEIDQRPGEPVDTITLYLLNLGTGETLDSEKVYVRPGAAGGAFDDAPMAPVLPLARAAQDVDVRSRFAFDDNDEVKDGDGNAGD